jgi:diaminopimelate epimerase
MTLAFTKMNGAGNDFVVLDNRTGTLALTSQDIARVCDRHRGVGADGLLLVEPPENGADFRMRYYNADGGEAEMCGNGARCFARFARQVSGHAGSVLSFETPAGVITATFDGEQVEVVMSNPHSHREPARLPVRGRDLEVHFLNTGVPHAVVFVDDLENTDVCADGAALRYHEAFAPRGTNANFAQSSGPSRIALRTYERGVEGETLACGTGVCAAAILHHLRTGEPAPIAVTVQGGDTLLVNFVHEDGAFRQVTLKGPADFVFAGSISL